MKANSVVEKIGDQLSGSSSVVTEQEQRDRKYNHIGRDYPAYIALLYPLVCLLIILKFGNALDSYAGKELEWVYAFDIIVGLGVFIPALFFFFKIVARDVSVFFVDIIGGLFSKSYRLALGCKYEWLFRLSKEEVEELKNAVGIESETLQKRDMDRIYREVRDEECVRTDHIVLDYNCFYGFYRNLSGGIFIDLIFALALTVFAPDGSDLKNFASGSWPYLLGGWIILLIFAYCARITLNHRRFNTYCKQKC